MTSSHGSTRVQKPVASPQVSSYLRLMRRITIILVLFILLMNGRHLGTVLPAALGRLSVDALALPLGRAGSEGVYGPLRLTGAWHLTSSHNAFGGISALTQERDGSLTGLSDSGELFNFHIDGAANRGVIKPLPRAKAEQGWPRWRWDSESMTRDPVSGQSWVGFEHLQRICRYAPDFANLENCVSPTEMKHWPATGSIESLVRFDDGRFLAIGEMAVDRTGAFEVLLWSGDPVDQATPPPSRLRYLAPPGYRPTDAIWLGGDKLLVLNRRLTLAHGFSAQISLVQLPPLRAGSVLIGHPIATFTPPGLADNFEGLALGRDKGRPLLWMASDDNRLFLQRSLLLRFEFPQGWLSDDPAP